MASKRLGIGRDESNDIVIDDPSVSRHHAELIENGGGHYVLRDLDSTHGTAVKRNGEWVTVTETQVARGNLARLGNYVRSIDSLIDAGHVKGPKSPKSQRAQTQYRGETTAIGKSTLLLISLVAIAVICGIAFMVF